MKSILTKVFVLSALIVTQAGCVINTADPYMYSHHFTVDLTNNSSSVMTVDLMSVNDASMNSCEEQLGPNRAFVLPGEHTTISMEARCHDAFPFWTISIVRGVGLSSETITSTSSRIVVTCDSLSCISRD